MSQTANYKFLNFLERGKEYSFVKQEKIEKIKKEKEINEMKGVSFQPQKISRNIYFKHYHKSFLERENIFLSTIESKKQQIMNSIITNENNLKNKRLNKRRKSIDINNKCIELYNKRIEHEEKINLVKLKRDAEVSMNCTFAPKINKSSSTKYLKKRNSFYQLSTQSQGFEYLID